MYGNVFENQWIWVPLPSAVLKMSLMNFGIRGSPHLAAGNSGSSGALLEASWTKNRNGWGFTPAMVMGLFWRVRC